MDRKYERLCLCLCVCVVKRLLQGLKLNLRACLYCCKTKSIYITQWYIVYSKIQWYSIIRSMYAVQYNDIVYYITMYTVQYNVCTWYRAPPRADSLDTSDTASKVY